MAMAVLTSGGDAPGMNAAVRAAVKYCARNGTEVLGVRNGYEGLIDGNFLPLLPRDVDPIGAFGGTILGSARSMRFLTPEGRASAAAQLTNLDGLLVIGGNGSLNGAHVLHQEHGTPVVGIPASIDNDIGCTSLSIGVDTALNTIVEACDRISDTARAHRRVFVVEVMGRQCGYLAMASAVAAGADACLFREHGMGEDEIVAALTRVIHQGFSPERAKQRVLILKAEGVEVPTQRLVERLATPAESVQADVRGTVLGHLVRGGSPSYQDRMIAGRTTVAALDALYAGSTDVMVAWQPSLAGITTQDPSCALFSLEDVLAHTATLLDGTSPVTQRRVRMMQAFEGVLSI
jgi:6-phosphofructokinase 1